MDELHDLVEATFTAGCPPWLTPRARPRATGSGRQFLRFERHGVLAHVTVDRPEARNALTPAMYFGIRYAIDHVNREPDLAGLLITGTGDVFIPGGELGGRRPDDWGMLHLLGMDVVPFDAVRRSLKPIVCAVNGICQGGIAEGELGAGDAVTVLGRPAHGITLELVSRAILLDDALLADAAAAPELPAELAGWMRERAA